MTGSIALLPTIGCLCSTSTVPSVSKPNILFLFSDDQALTALHAAGNKDIHTPNLDRLAKRGILFTNAHNQGAWSGAVCVASRCMLNTGQFLWNAHKTEESIKNGQDYQLWPELMKKAGYKTYFSGKWHTIKNPPDIFDVAKHLRPGMPTDSPEGYNRPVQGVDDPWKPWKEEYGGHWKGGKHWTEVLGDDTLDFLDDAEQQDKPFFMYLAFSAPHDPRQSPKKYVDMHPLDKISMPENFLPEYPYNEQIESGRNLRDERLAPFPRTEYAVKVHRQEYYAIVTHLDAQVGRILDKLEQSGLDKNTYIFFTSDHGLAVGEHGLMGKQNLFEDSIKPPLIVCGPGVPKGKKTNQLAYLQDVMPTSLELAEQPIPDSVQFKSLLPAIRSCGKDTRYDTIVGGYTNSQRMIKDTRYKLLMFPNVPKVLLFDFKKDPHEMNDLADQPKYRETMKQLFAEFQRQQKIAGDHLDLTDVFPDLVQ